MNKLLIFGVLMLALSFVTDVRAQKESSGNVKTSIKTVTVFGGSAVIPAAGSTVSRNNDGVYWNISTSSLTPGEVVTLWVAFFNYPFYCDQIVPGCAPSDLNNPLVQGSLQYGGGAIVGANGRADFSGYLAVGDNTGAYVGPPFTTIPNPAPGLLNPKGGGHPSGDPTTRAGKQRRGRSADATFQLWRRLQYCWSMRKYPGIGPRALKFSFLAMEGQEQSHRPRLNG